MVGAHRLARRRQVDHLAGVLVAAYRARGRPVGVLAVDPSSPFTGGALLGDRVRMQRPRPRRRASTSARWPPRGHLGGLAGATPQAVRVLDAAGCDVVLVETVGVGQAEVEVAGAGRHHRGAARARRWATRVQAAKAGILEIADVFVVNKADRDGADAVARELGHMLAAGRGPQPWRLVPVVTDRGRPRRGCGRAGRGASATHRAHMDAQRRAAERRRRGQGGPRGRGASP